VYAILENHVEATRALIAIGANVNVELPIGSRPVDLLLSSDVDDLRALGEKVSSGGNSGFQQ
jgi:hypothetical protein